MENNVKNITDSFCYMPETNTVLWINYTIIKNAYIIMLSEKLIENYVHDIFVNFVCLLFILFKNIWNRITSKLNLCTRKQIWRKHIIVYLGGLFCFPSFIMCSNYFYKTNYNWKINPTPLPIHREEFRERKL